MQWVLDPMGTVIYRSSDWFGFTGLGEKDARSKIRSRAVHPDDFGFVEQQCQEAIQLQSPFLLTFRLRHGEDYSWVMSGGSPSISPVDGSFLGYLGSTQPFDHLAYTFQTSKTLDVIKAPGVRKLKSSVFTLDAILTHVFAARAIATHHNESVIEKYLDLVLLTIGDLLHSVVNRSRS